MKISCDVIRDLLPLYAEDMVSAGSKKMVEEHLQECPSCVKALNEIREPVVPIREKTGSGLKQFRKRMIQKLVLGLMAVLFCSITVVVWCCGLMRRANVLPEEDAWIHISETEQSVIMELEGKIAQGFELTREKDPATGLNIYYISGGQSLADALFGPDDDKTITLERPIRETQAIWYYHYGELTCLYGQGEPVMPRSAADPILWWMLGLGALLAVIALILQNKLLGYSALWTFLTVLADFTVTGCDWFGYGGAESVPILLPLFMAMGLLLTCCIVFGWEFLKDQT